MKLLTGVQSNWNKTPKLILANKLFVGGWFGFSLIQTFSLSFVLLQSVPLPWYFNDIMLCSFFALMGFFFFEQS